MIDYKLVLDSDRSYAIESIEEHSVTLIEMTKGKYQPRVVVDRRVFERFQQDFPDCIS